MTQLGRELGRRAHCGRAKCAGALLSNGGRVPIRARVDAGGTRRAATHAQMVTVTARRRWEHSRPMGLVFTTCWATCGNGWRTARERRRKSAPSERYGEVVTGRRPWEMRASPASSVGVIQRLDFASPAIAMLRARNSSGQRCRLGGASAVVQTDKSEQRVRRRRLHACWRAAIAHQRFKFRSSKICNHIVKQLNEFTAWNSSNFLPGDSRSDLRAFTTNAISKVRPPVGPAAASTRRPG